MADDSDAFLRQLARVPDRAPPGTGSREGTRVGRFELAEELGRGGMGVVHAARDASLGRRVAIKVLTPDDDQSDEQRKRLLREARAASAIRHPNVATIFEVGEHEGELFVVMELVEGRSLRRVLSEGRPPIDEALRIGHAIASGIGAAHRAGVVHRDLKPENVMLEPDGEVKLLDFGLAKHLPETERAAPTDDLVTEKGVLLGTPSYMSPEQALGHTVDARTDVFALGVILYEMLAGQRPFDGATRAATIIAASRDDPEPLHKRPPHVSRTLSDAIAAMLSKRPEDRPQNGDAAAAALTAAMVPTRRWPKAAAVVALAGATAGLVYAMSTPSAPSRLKVAPTREPQRLDLRATNARPAVATAQPAAPAPTAPATPAPAPPRVRSPTPSPTPTPLDPLADQK